ncbi:MAG: response regulator [Kofleriaceae bacterium]
MESYRALVVEDDPDVARLVAYNLETAGFTVVHVADADAAIAAARRLRPHVIVLDVMLGEASGVDVCRAVRADAATADVGVLMLTALGDDDDRVAGLEAGADDYVVKPFVVREVVLRCRALAGRVAPARGGDEPRVLRVGAVELDERRQSVTVDGVEAQLRPLERRLLAVLLAEPGRVFSRTELLTLVWGLPGDLNTRTVDVHVRRLRVNLGGGADVVETVPGFGYRARVA